MFKLEELEALARMCNTVHKAEKAAEVLLDVTIAPSSKMEVLMIESRINEEHKKLMDAAKKEAAAKEAAPKTE